MTNRSLTIITESAGSGMGRFTVELANAIAAAGVDTLLVSPEQQHPLQGVKQNVLQRAVSRRRLDKLLSLARLSLGLAAAAWRYGSRRTPLLMVHVAPSLPVSLLPIVVARWRRAPLALNLHDFYPHTLRFPRALHGLERALYRWAYRRFDVVLTTTPEQTRRLVSEAGYPPERVASLYHGVFTVPGIVPPAPDAELTLLVFGSLRPNKRVLESIEAVRALRAAGHAVRLRIAGAPRREDADYWTACLAALPPDRDGFEIEARFVDERELPLLYSGVDAFLCPYTDFDSQSGVSMTAVSNGIPVVGTMMARAADVEPGGDGWTIIAPSAERTAIEHAILSFAAIPRLRRLAAATATRDRVQAAAGWPRLGRLYVEAMAAAGFWRAASATPTPDCVVTSPALERRA